MFLIDDLLLAPGKAALLLAQELARKAQDEWLNDDTIKQELQELYGMLEAGRISETEFDAREGRLLEMLEKIARLRFPDQQAPAPGDGAIVQSAVTVSAFEPGLPPAAAPLLLTSAPPAAPSPIQPWPPSPSIAPPVAAAAPAMAWPAPPVVPPAIAPPPVVPAAVVLPVAVPPAVPEAVPAMPSAGCPPTAGAPLSIAQIMECAVRALAMLKMRVSAITSVMPDQGNWKVSVELVERRGIPDTNDVLGMYELWLDGAGTVLRYERTHLRRRCDFAR